MAGIVAAIYLGLTAGGHAALAQHISIGIFSTMITLLAHSMMMFYFLGKGKAVREAAAEGGLSSEFERRIAVARKPVFSIAMLAMVATMVTALAGASVDTAFCRRGSTPCSRIRCLALNLGALRVEINALTESGRVVAEVNQLLLVWGRTRFDPAQNVEKQYGGLRPLRVRDLRMPAGRITMLIGFDRPAAEVFVNLITGACASRHTARS